MILKSRSFFWFEIISNAARPETVLVIVAGHYVPLLSLAVAQYSRANADSEFNLQGMAVGERASELTQCC